MSASRHVILSGTMKKMILVLSIIPKNIQNNKKDIKGMDDNESNDNKPFFNRGMAGEKRSIRRKRRK
ncbi:hypothetical protein PAE4_40145 [Bacillus altitudinis]|nr:hypothetical protein PAE4_40145 [Bacillus altitudinis]